MNCTNSIPDNELNIQNESKQKNNETNQIYNSYMMNQNNYYDSNIEQDNEPSCIKDLNKNRINIPSIAKLNIEDLWQTADVNLDKILKNNSGLTADDQVLRYQNISHEFGPRPRKRFHTNNFPKLKSPEKPFRKCDINKINLLHHDHREIRKAIRNFKRTREDINPLYQSTSLANQCERRYGAPTSPLKGWQRVSDKYHGNTEVFMSPIKHNLGFIEPTLYDHNFFAFVWLLNMTESIYYDNIILLLSRFRDQLVDETTEHASNVCRALRNNYTAINLDTLQYWKNVIKLGEGSFGSVYKVTDSRTNEAYAVKHIKTHCDPDLQKQLYTFLEFLRERNSLMRVYNNPLIMQFVSSFKIPDVDGLFLVFEYCVSDLSKFLTKVNKLKYYRKSSFISKLKKTFSKPKVKKTDLEKLYKNISKTIKYNYQEIVIVYAFELFLGLDFLAKCDIIHQDIKPANILISKDMHLKIGDLGLVINKYYNTCDFNTILMELAFTMANEAERYEFGGGGTLMYLDPDNVIHKLPNDHMSDAYAIALVISELMFLGESFFGSLTRNSEVQRITGILDESQIHQLISTLTECTNYYEDHVKGGIIGAFNNKQMRKLGALICPLFLPRRLRETNYLSLKKSQKYSAGYYSAYVDIERLIALSPFVEMNLSPHNVLTYRFPLKKFLDVNENERETPIKFTDVIDDQFHNTGMKMLNMEPGLNLNMY